MITNSKLRYLTHASIIAALYVALTAIFQAISFGALQVRVSEALCVLPVLSAAAVPGLFIGCLISNILWSGAILDIIVGSLTTLVAAAITYRLRKKPLIAFSAPVILNALAIAAVLGLLFGVPYGLGVLYVGIGQIIACYGLGVPLWILLRKYKDTLFRI